MSGDKWTCPYAPQCERVDEHTHGKGRMAPVTFPLPRRTRLRSGHVLQPIPRGTVLRRLLESGNADVLAHRWNNKARLATTDRRKNLWHRASLAASCKGNAAWCNKRGKPVEAANYEMGCRFMVDLFMKG